MGAPALIAGQHGTSARRPAASLWRTRRGLLDLPLPNLRLPPPDSDAGAAVVRCAISASTPRPAKAAGHERLYWPCAHAS